MEVNRHDLVVGNEYSLRGAIFFYLGKFYDELDEKDSLCFYPMNEQAKAFFKKEDGTVCFCDVDSFYLYDEE